MAITKAEANTESLRCDCGSLLARLVEDGVEIKCRRCKRRVVIPLQCQRTTLKKNVPSG